MYNQGEIKGLFPESCYLRPLSNLFMKVMEQLGRDLPNGTVPEPSAQLVGVFLVFTYIWQEDVAKIPKVPLATRNVNPAR